MVAIPALIYLADLNIKEAIALSLWIVAIVSFVALIMQRPWRHLQIKVLLTLGITGVIGSSAGARFAVYIPDTVQQALFSILIFIVVWWMSRVKLNEQVKVMGFPPTAITGLTIGSITGVLGVGGGFLLVPALIYAGIQKFQIAVAHSLVLIVINALVSALIYSHTTSFPVHLGMFVAGLAVIGSVIGSALLKTLPTQHLQQGFNLLLITLGGFMLAKIA